MLLLNFRTRVARGSVPVPEVCGNRHHFVSPLLPPVVRARFRVDQDTKQVRRVLLEADFEFGLDIVHTRKGKIIGERAVTGDVETSANPLDDEIMNVENLGKFRGHGSQSVFTLGVADQLLGSLNRGGLALDVGKNVGDLGHVTANVGFELRDLVVGLDEGHAFVQFDVLLDVKTAGKVLHADVMYVEVMARGYCPDSIEDIFGALGSGQRLHGDVGIGKDTLDCGGHSRDELSRTLEGNRACQANGKIGKVPVASAANAHTVDFEYAIHA